MTDEDVQKVVLRKAIKDLRKRIKHLETYDNKYDQPGEYLLKYQEHLEELAKEQVRGLNPEKMEETLNEKRSDNIEDKYHRFFEASPESIIILDTNGKIIDCNENTFNVIGLQKDKIIGKSFSKLGIIEKKDLNKYIDILVSLSSGKKLTPIEIRVENEDGNEQWLEIFPSPIKKGNKIFGIQIITRDITSRKQSEQALLESEKNYRLVVDNISDNIWIMNMVLQTTYSSPAVERILGYSPEEVKNKSINELLTPESLQLAEHTLKEELKNEQKKGVDPNRSRILELQMRHKDGSIIWTEVKISFLRNSKGNPIGVLGITRNINKQKQIELKQRESEEKYQRLIENITDVVVEIDIDGNFIYVSPQIYENFGFEPKEVLGKNVFEFIHPDDYEAIAETLIKALTENKRVAIEFRTLHKDGHYVPVSTYGNLIEDNGVKKIIGVVRDMTNT